MNVNRTPSIWDAAADRYDDGARRNRYYEFATSWFAQHCHDLDDLPECRILDLGCGNGLNVRLLSQQRSGIRADGVDISPKMIECARATNKYEKLYIHDLDTALPQVPSDEFDLTVAFGFLEFLTDAYICLSECHRVLRRNGKLWATFQRFEAEDAGSPPRLFSVNGIRGRGYSAGEILYMMSDLGMRVMSLDSVVGYRTQNGFYCPYYVLQAFKISDSASRPSDPAAVR